MDFNLEEKLLKMESVPNSYLDHIATYIRHKKFPITNSKQLTSYVKRNLRPAKDLEGFTSKQIYLAMEELEKDYLWRLENKGKGGDWKWTLETVWKHLTK